MDEPFDRKSVAAWAHLDDSDDRVVDRIDFWRGKVYALTALSER
jgi:hypothetical protein